MSVPRIKTPLIPCRLSNHHKHLFEFICMNKQCLQLNQNPLCFYCLKQSHSQHQSHIISLNQFVLQCWEISSKRTKSFNQLTNEEHQQFYKLENILLEGFVKCRTREEMAAVLDQIYRATFMTAKFSDLAGKRIQKVVDYEVKKLWVETRQFYQTESNHNSENKNHASLTTPTQFNTPILSFSPSLPSSQNFTFHSPFQATHLKHNTISSITAHPSLSTFSQSLEILIKIIRLTPNWIGIGISTGQHKYQEKSKNHVTLLSNGWLNERGEMEKVNEMAFETGQIIGVKCDREKKFLIFRNLTTKHEVTVKFQPEWNQDIFFCATMFFKNDTIALLQAGQQ